jgi:DNA-binding transcriptional regulator PaaX
MSQLMKKFVGNRCCLGLLRFFAVHPNGRFSKLAVVHAIDEAGSRLEVERALTQMVNEGILKTVNENNNTFYLLTKEEELRRLILNMALFDWRDWQLVLEHS